MERRLLLWTACSSYGRERLVAVESLIQSLPYLPLCSSNRRPSVPPPADLTLSYPPACAVYGWGIDGCAALVANLFSSLPRSNLSHPASFNPFKEEGQKGRGEEGRGQQGRKRDEKGALLPSAVTTDPALLHTRSREEPKKRSEVFPPTSFSLPLPTFPRMVPPPPPPPRLGLCSYLPLAAPPTSEWIPCSVRAFRRRKVEEGWDLMRTLKRRRKGM